MNTKVAAIWCLSAYLCGCAHGGGSSHTVLRTNPPAVEPVGNQASGPGARLVQRADDLAGKLRDKAGQVPNKTQGFLDSVGDSDVVRCMLPVLAIAGVVGAILMGNGGPIGCLNFNAPAAPSS
jgi:hypothetical protein